MPIVASILKHEVYVVPAGLNVPRLDFSMQLPAPLVPVPSKVKPTQLELASQAEKQAPNPPEPTGMIALVVPVFVVLHRTEYLTPLVGSS